MKNFINKILDVPKLIMRIWILLWLLLAILLVMKFCFGIWYPVVINNENLIKFNDLIKGSFARYIFSGVFYVLSSNILYLTSCKKLKYDSPIETIIINCMSVAALTFKILIPPVGIVIEILFSVIIPIIYLVRNKKCYKLWIRILYPIFIQLLVFLWQLNIYLIRGMDMNKISNEYFIIGFALQLDYYIFLIITWIGVNYMGIWSLWIFNQDITALKAEKEKELGKKNPNMKKVESLEIQIAKLEKEGK